MKSCKLLNRVKTTEPTNNYKLSISTRAHKSVGRKRSHRVSHHTNYALQASIIKSFYLPLEILLNRAAGNVITVLVSLWLKFSKSVDCGNMIFESKFKLAFKALKTKKSLKYHSLQVSTKFIPMFGADIIISSFSLAYEAKIFPNDSAFCSNSSLPIVASIVCRLVQATLLLDSRRFENTILNFRLYNKVTKICNHNYGLYYILTVSAMKVSDLISRLTASLKTFNVSWRTSFEVDNSIGNNSCRCSIEIFVAEASYIADKILQ